MKRRFVLGSGTLITLLALAGIWGPREPREFAAKWLERRWLVLTGGLVDAGGHKLRIERMGKGSPTVVFESGLAQPRNMWGTVPGEVAKYTRVVIYERAGINGSDLAPTPRTITDLVEDLHRLLKNAEVGGPYVLVGHSIGGLNVRLFASKYPEEVAGLVLVDSSHEDEYQRIGELLTPEAREGYLKHEGGGNPERVDLLASASQLKASAPLKEMPIIVLSAPGNDNPATGGARGAQVHNELQASFQSLFPHSTRILVEKSGHFIQLDQPEIVADSISKVVQWARQKVTVK